MGCNSENCHAKRRWLNDPRWEHTCNPSGMCCKELGDKKKFGRKCANCSRGIPMRPAFVPPGLDAAGAGPAFDATKAEADIANNAKEVSELKQKVCQLLVRVVALEQASPP